MIKRFGRDMDGYMELCDYGDYVRFDDVSTKLRAFDEIRALLNDNGMISDAQHAWDVLESISTVISAHCAWEDE